jgi:hypothetical protein
MYMLLVWPPIGCLDPKEKDGHRRASEPAHKSLLFRGSSIDLEMRSIDHHSVDRRGTHRQQPFGMRVN